MAYLTNTSNTQEGCVFHIGIGHNTNATIAGTVFPTRMTCRNASAGAVTFTVRSHANTLLEIARVRCATGTFQTVDIGSPVRVTGGLRIFRRGYTGNIGVNSTVTCQIYTL